MDTSDDICDSQPPVIDKRYVLSPKTMAAMKKGAESFSAIPAVEVQAALEEVLSSRMFRNALRMNHLLRYLIEKAISGAIRDTSEYIIGVEVFERNPATYTTNSDPIVRVQVGRLREKLKVYYATFGVDSDIEISIPVGSYMPAIRRNRAVSSDVKPCNMLAINPFKCISHHNDGATFTQGLNDELMHQLFKGFGGRILAYSFLASGDADNENGALKNVSRTGVNHLLEGSVQIDAERIRASIRLVDVSVGCIAWSEQFDRNAFFAIALQEELATSICGGVKRFFCLA